MINITPLKIIHISLCFGILLFAAVVYFINKDLLFFNFSLRYPTTSIQILSFVAIIFTVVAMNLGTMLFKNQLLQLDPLSSLESKFMKYQTAFLIKCALLEAAAIFNISMCLITLNIYFIIAAAFPLAALLLMRPTKEKVYTALQIQDTDQF